MIPQTTELSQIQAAFIDKDNRIEELMRQINSAQSLLNSLKDTMNSRVGDGKITIQTYAGSNVGDFTVNQKEDKTITLPQQATVNNGKLTITRNGTYIAEFTANQSGDTPVDITVPTKTSEITNDSDFVSDANYVHTDNNFTNADKAEIGKINNSLQFTYVVDSNQKLADWANNVAGNDYTSVLIKKGIWSYNAGSVRYPLNLTATGTKVIIGEVGSQLQIIGSSSIVGLYYETVPDITDIDYLIFNVTVKVIGGRYNYAFYRCVNLYHCIGIDASSTGSSSYSFLLCNNLIRCKGTENRGTGFRECHSVKECVGNSYYLSYYSPTDDSTYLCDNTLNGGWNTTAQ